MQLSEVTGVGGRGRKQQGLGRLMKKWEGYGRVG